MIPLSHLLTFALSLAHPGGLDAQGGHWDRSTDPPTYHLHRAATSQPTPPVAGRAAIPAHELLAGALAASSTFDQCRSGPDVPAGMACRIFYDFDGDADIDQDDYGKLQAGWLPVLSWLDRWLRWANARGSEIRELKARLAQLQQEVEALRADLAQALAYQGEVLHRLDQRTQSMSVRSAWIWNGE